MKDLDACSLSATLFHVWIPLHSCCHNSIRREGGKAKVDPFDRRLFENRLDFDVWERGTKDRKKKKVTTLLLGHIILTETMG